MAPSMLLTPEMPSLALRTGMRWDWCSRCLANDQRKISGSQNIRGLQTPAFNYKKILRTFPKYNLCLHSWVKEEVQEEKESECHWSLCTHIGASYSFILLLWKVFFLSYSSLNKSIGFCCLPAPYLAPY